MTKHTSGPWRRNGTLIEGPKMALQVASVYPPAYVGNAPRNDDEFQANARLIAAAPDLLDALHYAVDTILEGAGGRDDQLSDGERTTIELARAAIAKAEGQS